jgi:proteasome activator subunit 4
MKYPMSRPVRAKLARFYYELISELSYHATLLPSFHVEQIPASVLPGTEPALIRSHADMLRRLIRTKRGSKPKLTLEDLELPWEPLWTVMKKEVFPNSRSSDSRYDLNCGSHVNLP